jgi:hypothetical protein
MASAGHRALDHESSQHLLGGQEVIASDGTRSTDGRRVHGGGHGRRLSGRGTGHGIYKTPTILDHHDRVAGPNTVSYAPCTLNHGLSEPDSAKHVRFYLPTHLYHTYPPVIVLVHPTPTPIEESELFQKFIITYQFLAQLLSRTHIIIQELIVLERQ